MATTTDVTPNTGDQTRKRLGRWLLDQPPQTSKQAAPEHPSQPWWKVMCLTGVDYYSTLGYQPGIAALAAGVLSPVATLVLVALTLAGALPVYRRVARESPNGQGSIAMLEKLLPKWKGKLLVLVLLGFVATDFVITMTLSAADASAHAIENPFFPSFLHGQQVLVTLVLLAALGAVFLKGFSEAIGIAVALVGAYLALNVVVVVVSLVHVFESPKLVLDWEGLLVGQYHNPWLMIGVALLVFPKLALGLSGFETGVAVMPQVRGAAGDTAARPEGRIRNTRKLLTTAAVVMSVFLISSSVITSVLIPQAEFRPGGEANGRALAFLAHEYLGSAFGTVYDISTIGILWFAGASAMAGLLNIVPRYLPRYGMAPDWVRANRPLVLVFLAIAFGITVIFQADVDAQGGAYATGVLVLISSAALAVMLSALRKRQRAATVGFGVITAVFAYTTVVNVIERPDGVRIAAFFIVAIIVTSFVSRATRSLELRFTQVDFDDTARRLIAEHAAAGQIQLIANEPDARDEQEYVDKEREQREDNHIPAGSPVMFLEITIGDASDFTTELSVHGEERFGYQILKVNSPTVPNAIAAILLKIRDETGVVPHVYFAWAEGNPFLFLFHYLFSGAGDVPPVTREVLRRAEPDPELRPAVHVG
ncbi:amino acid transporter [Kutzneria sp. CA-103260]|uniref:amino acid transporter n=1 Tax=Kutzneria sp. CA-103260 TaxID=2802641 RepID=UPI001BF0C922|nr:amino acid transporter [Kutzneria sp. CA-103260]QUQ66600.1 amino acid transporter [Kutzneria sp. CA-103260]